MPDWPSKQGLGRWRALRVRILPPDGKHLVHGVDEELQQLRIEMPGAAQAHDVCRLLYRNGLLIDALGRHRVEGDRKSTRLNSSHSQISYAVFCLKKKKKNINLMTIEIN